MRLTFAMIALFGVLATSQAQSQAWNLPSGYSETNFHTRIYVGLQMRLRQLAKVKSTFKSTLVHLYTSCPISNALYKVVWYLSAKYFFRTMVTKIQSLRRT